MTAAPAAAPTTAHGHGHGHGHGHSHAPHAPADVLAYLNGTPIPRHLLDTRLAALRAGDAACVLPREGTREARQMARWVAQIIITEHLCQDELTRQHQPTPSTATAAPLDVSTAIAVGSITAAALAGSEVVRRVAELVSREVRIPAEQLAYAADVLGVDPPADPAVPAERWHAELLDSARLEAFARWLNAAQHERVQLVHGLEHPGDSNQPDNLHRH
ncbi:malonyl CoA-ACP transacylase [Kribbella sancticallisti]|uniref:Malonyl CoA-ACP transacylase n=1 Tax=Kribbella sancticallisti TaxID=460087 RepID=A0ABP4PKP1_9ACTN